MSLLRHLITPLPAFLNHPGRVRYCIGLKDEKLSCDLMKILLSANSFIDRGHAKKFMNLRLKLDLIHTLLIDSECT